MELRQVFNIFLLGLILTTIVTTLVVYLVFKFRQGVQVIREKDIELEGEFFVRHAPHLEKRYKEEMDALLEARKKGFFSRHKTKWIVGGTFVIILFFLSIENYLSFRKTVIKRQTSAEEYLELIKAGLLKKYPYLPSKIFSKPLNQNKVEFNNYSVYNLQLLKKKHRLVLIESPRSLKNSKSFHKLALERWLGFCSQYELRCVKRSVGTSKFNAKKDIIVFPSVESISGSERIWAMDILSKDYSIFFTGAVGVLNGLGKKNSDGWFLKNFFATDLIEDVPERSSFPTSFNIVRDSNYRLPSGLLLDWLPLNPKFSYMTAEAGKLKASDFNFNVFSYENMFESRFKKIGKKISWIMLDPVARLEPTQKGQAQASNSLAYSDQYLIQSLMDITDNKRIRPLKWPNAKPVAGVVSLIATDQYLKLNEMLKGIDNLDIPFTVFTQADLYENFYEDIKLDYLEKEQVELSLINQDSTRFEEASFKDVFDKIESGRLLIERKNKRIVKGFYPPGEYIDKQVFSAAVQNGLNYILGRFESNHNEPHYMRKLGIHMVPRSGLLDIDLVKNPELVRPDDLQKIFEEEFKKYEAKEGLFGVHLNTKVFGDDNFKPFFKRTVNIIKDKSDYWWTTYRDLVRWQANERLLRIRERKDGSLEIWNQSLEAIEGMSFYSEALWEAEELNSFEVENGYHLIFKSIGPGEKVILSPKNN